MYSLYRSEGRKCAIVFKTHTSNGRCLEMFNCAERALTEVEVTEMTGESSSQSSVAAYGDCMSQPNRRESTVSQ